jgi:hypothetical protein
VCRVIGYSVWLYDSPTCTSMPLRFNDGVASYGVLNPSEPGVASLEAPTTMGEEIASRNHVTTART